MVFDHDAFGVAGGAGGVDDVGEVVGLGGVVGVVVGFGGEGRVVGVDAGEVAAGAVESGVVVGVSDEDVGVGVVEHVGQAFGGVVRGRGGGTAPPALRMASRVVGRAGLRFRQTPTSWSGRDAEGVEVVGELVGAVVELGRR